MWLLRAKRERGIVESHRMACSDAGPWPCVEQGCPSPWVSCEGLAVACKARFDDIWRQLPAAVLKGKRVADLCLLSCGTCEAHCELLGREILADAAPEREELEVQRLRFALPAKASDLPGPSAQVKVRAPDASGQQMRVRACERSTSCERSLPLLALDKFFPS